MERLIVELIRRKKKSKALKQQGMTLIELMIALLVLLIGVVGSMSLVALSIGSNGRNRQQSNSTSITQMITEKISSVKASSSPTLTFTDCTAANLTVFTSPGGNPVLSSGDIDFSQAPVAFYSIVYTTCGTNGRETKYDVRWNIQQPTAYVKILTVSAKMQGAGSNLKFFALPVTVRTLIGQGT